MADISEILPFLYLGDALAAMNWEVIKERNIKTVINCAKELETRNKFTNNGVEYFNVPVRDNPGFATKIASFFHGSAEAILKGKKIGGVLVHCSAGASRSPTIVLSYLILGEKMSAKEAWELLKSKRPIIEPQPTFMKKIVELEIQVFGKQSMDPEQFNDTITTTTTTTTTTATAAKKS